MVFSSLLFLFGFLPVFLTIYYLTPKKWKNLTILFFSYLFYAWGAPKFVFVLLLTSIIDYALSCGMTRYPNKKRVLLAIGLILNLGLLAYFKYANWFITEANRFLEILSSTSIQWTSIALPIGISFFTFQKISYLIDVYRGTTKPAKSFTNFALYVALFPQLIAGPIVRYKDIAKQITTRVHSTDKFFNGIWRFTLGLSKKILIANELGQVADAVFSLGNGDLTTGFAWLGILCYTFQIYFDFSGYSDMAIGLGKMMGFDILENFNKPYIAKNFTDFWRRWHISLSRFMRDYLYIPLGGNRVGKRRMYLNLWIVFVLSGIWHGAAWTFLIWGAWHGLFLMLDKMFLENTTKKLSAFITIPTTFLLVVIGWVFFRGESLSQSWNFLTTMFSPSSQSTALLSDFLTNRATFMFIIALIISFLPALPLFKYIEKKWNNMPTTTIQSALIILLFFLSTISLFNTNFNPFIYFRF